MIQYDILSLMSQGPVAIGAAVSTYTAQNLGAGKIQRIRQGVKASIHIMVIYFLILGSFIVFFGKYFTYLFVSEQATDFSKILFTKPVFPDGFLYHPSIESVPDTVKRSLEFLLFFCSFKCVFHC